MRLVEFGKAISNKDWQKAWDIATSFWYGSNTKQREVLFYMLKDIVTSNSEQTEKEG